jgi:radical SAM superfamily enzyme YgiQ (UPF0313 family)
LVTVDPERRKVAVVRVLLLSTYELGHQPLHVASPAAALRAAGHEVEVLDLAVDQLDPAMVREAGAVAISVPMHTAARLAHTVVEEVRAISPAIPVALYGLYAGEGATAGVSARLIGEYEPDLVDWVSSGAPATGTRISLSTGSFSPPARDLLPGLDRYGMLEIEGEHRPAGYVEASHGCRHRCRHCPIPAIYDGRYRIVSRGALLADVESQVAMGAGHLTWGDPDFLNGPRHALALIEEVHRRHPELTHDVTIKVEHLRRHDDVLPRLRAAGVLFVVSAFESIDDRTLLLLDKGHTVSDMSAVVTRARQFGMDIRPSWMPFVPWTTPSDVVGIFRFLADHDLLGTTDPVQMSIRLLIPKGSLMLRLDEVGSAITDYDEELLSYLWRSADPRSDTLHAELAVRAEEFAAHGGDPVTTLLTMWAEAVAAAGGDPATVIAPPEVTTGRPHLTETWFCCAEPTTLQSAQIRGRSTD